MSETIEEIGALDFKQYVKSSRACNFTASSCSILSSGRIYFKFPKHNYDRCKLFLKRTGGNGHISITEPYVGEIAISSKVSQEVVVNFDHNRILKISRPPTAIGDVDLIGIILYFDKEEKSDEEHYNVVGGVADIDQKIYDEDTGLPKIDWKSIISRCGKHSGLRLIRNKVFVSSGSFISNAKFISSIETDPPGQYTIDGDKIKFLSSCKIDHIHFSKDISPEVINKEIYPHRSGPTPKAINENYDNSESNVNLSQDIGFVKSIIESGPDNFVFSDTILFDTDKNGAFNAVKGMKSKNVKLLKSNGKDAVLLRTGGECNIPLSMIQSNQNYICVIFAKRLNGNGKLFFGLKSGGSVNYNQLGLSGAFKNHYKVLKSGNNIDSMNPCKLHFKMLENKSTGEIIIEKILLLKDSKRPEPNYLGKFSAPIFIQKVEDILVNGGQTGDIYKSTKIFARYDYEKITATHQFDKIKGNAYSSTISGVRWLNKVMPFFPKITLFSGESTDISLLISCAGGLRESSKIWIDHFSELSGDDINILNKADTIYTPSNDNAEIICEKCKDTNVKVCHKPLPFVTPKKPAYFPAKDYIVTFNRSVDTVKHTCDHWNSAVLGDYFSPLVIIGARGKYTQNVIPVNEYMPYEEVLYLLLHAKCVVDFDKNINYKSSFLELLMAANASVISTNKTIEKYDNGHLVKCDNGILPDFDQVKVGVEKALNNTTQPKLDAKYNMVIKDQFIEFYN
jgi:hypothetical protein